MAVSRARRNVRDVFGVFACGRVLSTAARNDAAERNQRKKYPYNVVVTLGKHELKVDPDVEVQG